MGMLKNTLSKDQIAQLLYLEVISEGIELASRFIDAIEKLIDK